MHVAQPIWLRPRDHRSHAAPLALCCVFVLLGTGAAPPAEREAVPEKPMAQRQRELYREKVRTIFTESFDAYMENAFPMPELKPKTCSAGGFDPCELPMLSLVDSLDTLAVLGNDTQFELAVGIVGRRATAPGFFDIDLKVNVFETTIRWLGGLLSAHCLAVNGTASGRFRVPGYNGQLLTAARELGTRLLPAFKTNTGIPYGTVNLRHGVPKGEVPVASVAGAGSLSIEFGMLSYLTGDARFAEAAYRCSLPLHSPASTPACSVLAGRGASD